MFGMYKLVTFSHLLYICMEQISYRNRRNFRRGLIFVNFEQTKNSEIILHMRIACHKKLYCTGQNDEVKSRWKLKILEKSGNVQN